MYSYEYSTLAEGGPALRYSYSYRTRTVPARARHTQRAHVCISDICQVPRPRLGHATRNPGERNPLSYCTVRVSYPSERERERESEHQINLLRSHPRTVLPYDDPCSIRGPRPTIKRTDRRPAEICDRPWPHHGPGKPRPRPRPPAWP